MDNKTSLDQIINEVNKTFGQDTVFRAINIKRPKIPRLPTGSYFLDYCLNGGFAAGRIIELFGLPSSGKSLICLATVAEVQKIGGFCVWVDCESAFDKSFAEKFGVDTKKLLLSGVKIGETTIDMLFRLLDINPALIVVDSVAAMIPRDDMEKSMEQATMATRARLMSRGLAKLNAKNKDTCIVFINQVRSDISSYGAPLITPGGKSLLHYASARVRVSRGEVLERNKQKVGQEIKFRVDKNKNGPPMREGYFNFYQDTLIDHVDELVALGILIGKIKSAGAWYYVGDEKFQGKEELVKAARKDPAMFEKFKKEIVNEDVEEKGK